MDQDYFVVLDGRENPNYGWEEIGEGFWGMEPGKHRSQERLGRLGLLIPSGYENGTQDPGETQGRFQRLHPRGVRGNAQDPPG
jgi:hypothetical protein